MKEAVLMTVCESSEGLIHYAFYAILLQILSSICDELVYVLIHEFKHKVEIIIDSYDFLELDNMLVIQFPQRLYFS